MTVTNPARRISGRRMVPIFVGLLFLALCTALFFWFYGRTPNGPILVETALGDGDTLVIREGYQQRDFVHLMRTRGDQTLWTVTLFGIQEHPAPQLAVHPDTQQPIVTVRARDSYKHAETHTFQLADGAFHWRGGRPSSLESDQLGRGTTLINATHIFELYEGAPPTHTLEVIVLAIADGTETWRKSLPDMVTPIEAKLQENQNQLRIHANTNTDTDTDTSICLGTQQGDIQPCR